MEGLLPIFGSWSRHSMWCHDRGDVVLTGQAHGLASALATEQQRARPGFGARDRIFLGARSRHRFEVATWLGWDRVARVTTGILALGRDMVGCLKGISMSRPTIGVSTWFGWVWGCD